MNIDDLTLGQLRELKKVFLGEVGPSRAPVSSRFMGRYCVVRCRGAGVHAGIVGDIDDNFLLLKESRRLWGWDNKKGFTLSCVALYGIDEDSSSTKVATQMYER